MVAIGIPHEVDISEEPPNFSSDEEDDITDEELLADLLLRKPKEALGSERMIVVDNLPQVGQEKFSRLQGVVRKQFGQVGTIVSEKWPKTEDGKTKGFIFLEFATPEQANHAVSHMNGHALDRKHKFAVNLFSDFERYDSLREDWSPPERKRYNEPGNLKSWLADQEGRDQYLVMYKNGETVQVNWNNQNGEPLVVAERDGWTEHFVQWSSKGTYLGTCHEKGVALWGADEFKQIRRFSHMGVQLIDFSPCERYIITFNPRRSYNEDSQTLIIWDIFTCQRKLGIKIVESQTWPVLKWSYDGKYFARMSPNTLTIYLTDTMTQLKSFNGHIPNIRDFSWSPTDNYLVYWTPEYDERPARAVILGISNVEGAVSVSMVTERNLFNVADCRFHWQEIAGNYLCIKVDRFVKRFIKNNEVKYGGLYHNFELFRIRERNVPVDKIEVKDEPIVAFAWEPVGHRFAFVKGESHHNTVLIYHMKDLGGGAAVGGMGKVNQIAKLEKKSCNRLFWNPLGQFLILAGISSSAMNGILEFYDVNDIALMYSGEHFMCTGVEWDPSGRYVATGVSYWEHKMENGFYMWNFQGRLMCKKSLDRFCQLRWRPRPPSILPEEDLKEVRRNMKKYSAQFEAKDKTMLSKTNRELMEKRQKAFTVYREVIDNALKLMEEEKEKRKQLRAGRDEMEESGEADVDIEILQSVEEQLLEPGISGGE